ncbi:hypothetical protein NHH88_05965 [Oxalobacteraceae bacterium OTU3CAMAD1]|nr:hypothetical protein NHH88_05965 [Oxalobacteraceae bacterium OTU3CAMAD1]
MSDQCGGISLGTSGWGDWTIVRSPFHVEVQEFSLNVCYFRGMTGDISCKLAIVNLQPISLKLTLPSTVLEGELPQGEIDLDGLLEYLLPGHKPLPAFLPNLPLPAIKVKANFARSIYTLEAYIGEIDMKYAGTIEKTILLATVEEGKKPTVCFIGTYHPPLPAKSFPCRYCYPFDEICDDIGQTCRPIPPPPPPPPPTPPPSPPPPHLPPDPTTREIIDWVARIITGGASVLAAVWASSKLFLNPVAVTSGVFAGWAASPSAVELTQLTEALETAYSETYQGEAGELVADIYSASIAQLHSPVTLDAMAIALSGGSLFTANQVIEALDASYSPSIQKMASALAASSFSSGQIARALRFKYPDQTMKATDMYDYLAQAYYSSALTAQQMANALAYAYGPIEVAPVLRNHYPAETITASEMAALLLTAYADAGSPVDLTSLASALAATPYQAAQVALVLKAQYPTEAGSAHQLVALLCLAYVEPPISLGDTLDALVVCGFNAYDMAPAVQPPFLPTSQALGLALKNAMRTIPPSATQMGAALNAAGYNSGLTAQGVLAAVPSTSVGVMAAVLLLLSDATMVPALSVAGACKVAGDGLDATAIKVVSTVPSVPEDVLAVALDAVFTPPNLSLGDVLAPLPKVYAQPNATLIAQGSLAAFPETSESGLVAALTNAFQTSAKPIDSQIALTAVRDAFNFIGKPLTLPPPLNPKSGFFIDSVRHESWSSKSPLSMPAFSATGGVGPLLWLLDGTQRFPRVLRLSLSTSGVLTIAVSGDSTVACFFNVVVLDANNYTAVQRMRLRVYPDVRDSVTGVLAMIVSVPEVPVGVNTAG